jgi:hypothetical protein
LYNIENKQKFWIPLEDSRGIQNKLRDFALSSSETAAKHLPEARGEVRER